MERSVYFDNQATTRPDPRVVEAMLPFLREDYGNAASRQHGFGRRAHEAVTAARTRVAELIGAHSKEIVFTSGATESINLALKGVAGRASDRPGHLVTTAIEHKAGLDTCAWLEGRGWAVSYVDVPASGVVEPEAIAGALRDDTALVSVMAANNEVGTLQPIPRVGEICRAHGAFFHTDAAQAVGKVPIDVEADHIDLLSLSGHKLHGPKGVGALYVRRRNPRVRLVPRIHGGGHERGLRSGTLNVPAIVGLGEACRIARAELGQHAARIQALRDRLHAGIRSGLTGVSINGDIARRLPGNLNLSFEGVEGDALMLGLKGIALSSGSACTSATLEPSHVLRAMGLPEDTAHSSIRFSLGRFNDEEEVDYVVERVISEVERLRRVMASDATSLEGTA